MKPSTHTRPNCSSTDTTKPQKSLIAQRRFKTNSRISKFLNAFLIYLPQTFNGEILYGEKKNAANMAIRYLFNLIHNSSSLLRPHLHRMRVEGNKWKKRRVCCGTGFCFSFEWWFDVDSIYQTLISFNSTSNIYDPSFLRLSRSTR